MPKFKIAGVQMDIRFADIEANLESMKEKLVQTCAAGAWLTVFPECTTTGYCFGTLEQAKKVAEPITGSTVSRVVDWRPNTIRESSLVSWNRKGMSFSTRSHWSMRRESADATVKSICRLLGSIGLRLPAPNSQSSNWTK